MKEVTIESRDMYITHQQDVTGISPWILKAGSGGFFKNYSVNKTFFICNTAYKKGRDPSTSLRTGKAPPQDSGNICDKTFQFTT